MSTLEALNAISEAIQAHAKLPEVERSLREAQENCDWKTLELDEANKLINELRTLIIGLEAKLEDAEAGLKQKDQTISELNTRNTLIDNNLTDLTVSYRNIELDRNEKVIVIDMQRDEISRLEAALEANKSLTSRLTETLRSIGASIVAAVEVPEVTSESPFPMADPVGLHSPTDAELDSALSNEPNGNVAEPTAADLVSDVAPGTNVYKYW